jgi:hypothetical protein
MKKKILIHIGPPKSGTSAIQLALQQNRMLLQAEGITYPEHEVGPNGISSGNLNTILYLNEDKKWHVSEQKVNELLGEFETSDAHTLLLSSEYFFYVAKEIADLIPNAKFIAYIRCPLDTFESSYNQSVKRHMRTAPVFFGKNLHMTTLNILSEAIDLIGRKRFLLRAYLPPSAQGYSLLDDFCAATKLPSLPASRKITNNSYSFEALEFKRWLNNFELKNLDILIDQSLQACWEGVMQFSFLPEEQFSRYQKQSLHSVRDFVHTYKVFNGKALITYLKNRSSLEYMHQSLTDVQLLGVCRYLLEHHSELYKQVCVQLSKTTSLKVEHADRVNILLQQSCNSQSMFTRALGFFKGQK